MKKLSILFILILSCNHPENCNDLATKLKNLQVAYSKLEKNYSNLLEYCDSLNIPIDTCDYPDTFNIYTDTTGIEIYQTCFWCVKDSFKINSFLTGYVGYNNDTFTVLADTMYDYLQLRRYRLKYIDTTLFRYSNRYYRPLIPNIDYTEIEIYGFSAGVHHGEHDYEFAGTRQYVNGTDTLIKYGKLIYYDLPEEYSKKAYYSSRVMMPMNEIDSIVLNYFNDQSNEYIDKDGNQVHEDMNLYLTGLKVGGQDFFSPEYIENSSNYGWTNNDTMYILVSNGNVVVKIN